MLEVYRENLFLSAVEVNLLPLVTMLPRRWDHRLVEVYAADSDVSVSATNCRNDSIADAGTVIAECCRQVRRKFLEHWSQYLAL